MTNTHYINGKIIEPTKPRKRVPIKYYEEHRGTLLPPKIYSLKWGLNLDGTYESDKQPPKTGYEEINGTTYSVTWINT